MSSTEHDVCKWARWHPYIWDGRQRYPIPHENPMWEQVRQLNAALRGEPPCDCRKCRTDLPNLADA